MPMVRRNRESALVIALTYRRPAKLLRIWLAMDAAFDGFAAGLGIGRGVGLGISSVLSAMPSGVGGGGGGGSAAARLRTASAAIWALWSMRFPRTMRKLGRRTD